jgi:hypothetical protein
MTHPLDCRILVFVCLLRWETPVPVGNNCPTHHLIRGDQQRPQCLKLQKKFTPVVATVLLSVDEMRNCAIENLIVVF